MNYKFLHTETKPVVPNNLLSRTDSQDFGRPGQRGATVVQFFTLSTKLRSTSRPPLWQFLPRKITCPRLHPQASKRRLRPCLQRPGSKPSGTPGHKKKKGPIALMVFGG
ncbi:unnamed protein product [Tuber aestivum]|uniref:Uncharacterized protein n=1 Tax=Tuber aestivum TaxID=59557 RepID=A0A292PRQ6_9PEZI|nr:unnamed protein product [Tuber aestivum]